MSPLHLAGVQRENQLYVRVEDTIAVTAEGIGNLTAEAPLELNDVEAAIAILST